MPGLSGSEATRQITQVSPAVQVVILTVSDDEADVLEAIAAGACGYLLKTAPVDDLVNGIRQSAAGNAILSRDVAGPLMARVRADAGAIVEAPQTSFTPRELEVLSLIVEGANNEEIGERLFISHNTVKQYLRNIFEKLGVHNRAQAAVQAVRRGLL
jgi:DNA-binding NarL/FixJ family response regulator